MRERAGLRKFPKATITLASPEAQAGQFGAPLMNDRVTSLRKEKATFVASCSGADVYARPV
jgi:hypothetical protein